MADLMGMIQSHVAGLTPEQDSEETVTLLKLAANEIARLNIALHASIDSPKGVVPHEAEEFYKPTIYYRQ